jgi:Domain of unknown function (DUF4105)
MQLPRDPHAVGCRGHAVKSMHSALRVLIAAAAALCAGAAAPAVPAQDPVASASRDELRHEGLAADPASAPQAALVTFGPGEHYWERFGHNALIIDDPQSGARTVYNYGVFDFEEQHFLLNFARGHMRYTLDAEPLNADLAMYAAEGRSVTVQMLSLTSLQSRQLATFLAWNAQPQNADYRYDYFLNNCSTKVRDALNRLLNGALEHQLARQPAPHTYRFDAVRLVAPDFFLALGMDLGLGPDADRPLSLWQESFVPGVLSRALDGITVPAANGTRVPLVSEEQVVFAGTLPPPPAAPPDLRLAFLALGSGVAGLLLGLGYGTGARRRRAFATLAMAWWLICGCSGLVLAALWGLTDHWAAWRNENLLLLDPVCLFLPWVWWRAPGTARALATLIAAAALLSLLLRALPGWYQVNLAWIAVTLPGHLALAVLAWRQVLPGERTAHRRADPA